MEDLHLIYIAGGIITLFVIYCNIHLHLDKEIQDISNEAFDRELLERWEKEQKEIIRNINHDLISDKIIEEQVLKRLQDNNSKDNIYEI